MIGFLVPSDKSLASYRYRAMIPMREMLKLGADVGEGVGTVTVIHKHWLTLEQIKGLHGKTKLVLDVCDDHFGGQWDAYYREVIGLVDRVTVSTEAMRRRVLQETGVDATVISDPYEHEEAPLKLDKVKRIFWFGHKSNLKGLYKELPRLLGYDLHVMSNHPGTIPWSPSAFLSEMEKADIVIIPVPSEEKKQVKSPNRLVESVRRGRYVVANPLGSYKPYEMWQGDILEGLEWVSDNIPRARCQLAAARLIANELNNPAKIALQWLDVLKNIK